MSSVSTVEVEDLSGYLRFVSTIRGQRGNELWFRGCRSTKHQLLPSLYRKKAGATGGGLDEVERGLSARFKERSIPYLSPGRSLDRPWELAFFMQHYGVPTRLLDWSESPLIGLYFALMPANGVARKRDSDCVVWLFDPVAWNRHALSHITYKGGVLDTDSVELRSYEPGSGDQVADSKPLAIYGAHNSSRIVAQRGVFTVFGGARLPLEKLAKNLPQDSPVLWRMLLKKPVRGSVCKELLSLGVTESTVFPGLEGLAVETKRIFGYGGQ